MGEPKKHVSCIYSDIMQFKQYHMTHDCVCTSPPTFTCLMPRHIPIPGELFQLMWKKYAHEIRSFPPKDHSKKNRQILWRHHLGGWKEPCIPSTTTSQPIAFDSHLILRENRSLYKFIRILPYTESLTAGVLGITTKTKPSIPTNIPRLFQNSSLIFGCEDIPSRLSWRANGYVNFSGCGTKNIGFTRGNIHLG